MSFWDFIWFLFWTYIFIAYLMVMFQIITDIFRDHDLGGGAKALWFIGLLFLPIVVALIYLIARGKQMGERQMQRTCRAQGETEQYIQTVAPGGTRLTRSPQPRSCSTPAPSPRLNSTRSRSRHWPDRGPRAASAVIVGSSGCGRDRLV